MTKSQRKVSSNSSFLKALEGDFHRFWERPQKYTTGTSAANHGGTLDALDEILYAYESSDPEKNLYSAGQNAGFGPNVYKRTYTLFPRPGYYQHKCCGCGPRLAFCIFFFLIIIAVIAVLICFSVYPTGNSDASNPVQSQVPMLDVMPTTNRSENQPDIVLRRGVTTNETKQKLPDVSSDNPLLSTNGTKLHPPPVTFSPPPMIHHYLLSSTIHTLPVATYSDECHRCHRNAVCSNGTCRCRAGYEGDGIRVCANIDECTRSRGICGCNAACVDNPGSYTCSCKTGYEMADGSLECVDVDECKSPKPVCPALSQCINVSGGYRCVCRDGSEPNAEGNACRNAHV